jgi:hypothetical protein
MATFSFLNTTASISGPGGSFALGSGSGNAEEGITINMANDKSSLTIGADGSGMYSLHADKSGEVTITLLKTSPVNSLLMSLYEFQQLSSTTWGQNVITINDTASGDNTSARGCAFKKKPEIKQQKDAGTNQWVFQAISVDTVLGTF